LTLLMGPRKMVKTRGPGIVRGKMHLGRSFDGVVDIWSAPVLLCGDSGTWCLVRVVCNCSGPGACVRTTLMREFQLRVYRFIVPKTMAVYACSANPSVMSAGTAKRSQASAARTPPRPSRRTGARLVQYGLMYLQKGIRKVR
jgi:hypothetical protein